MYINIMMHAYSFNNIYFTIAWEVQCPLAQQHMRCNELVISDLQPYIKFRNVLLYVVVVVAFCYRRKDLEGSASPNSSWTAAF